MTSIHDYFSYIFINSSINTLLFYLHINSALSEKIEKIVQEAIIVKSIYKKQIRRYLGLGFLLSFIPGTEPFLARKSLFSSIKSIESLDSFGEKAIPEFLSNIFLRTVGSMLYHNVESSFLDIMLGRNTNFAGLNRINPFLYPVYFTIFIIKKYQELLFEILDYPTYLPFAVKILVYPILYVVYAIAIILLVIYAGLYVLTEFLLNTLHTLLIEPFIFAFEVMHQFVSGWGMDLAYMPTEDYKNLNQLVVAMDNEVLEQAELSNSLNVFTAEELTLVESTAKVIDTMEKHRNSFFYQLNKDNLFQKTPKAIKASYHHLENLRTFSYFTHKEMANIFPKELTKVISDMSLKLDAAADDKNQENIGLTI
ncbi:MAG: hypothetical protein H0T84_04375 [Tatlockia sp.]|nr:hypothetical protein [Tatlockia sp.]